MDRKEILKGAIKCVCHDRNAQYGSPENSFEEIAKLWSWWLDTQVTAHDVGIMMTLFKIGRVKTGGLKDDNYIDACGYLACSAEINSKGEKK